MLTDAERQRCLSVLAHPDWLTRMSVEALLRDTELGGDTMPGHELATRSTPTPRAKSSGPTCPKCQGRLRKGADGLVCQCGYCDWSTVRAGRTLSTDRRRLVSLRIVEGRR